MALRIVKASDPVTVEHLVLCIYSPPGLGKTSLGFTAADPLCLNFDNGVHRAANRKDSVPIDKWEDVTSITPEDLTPYSTILVDTAGRCLDFLTADIISKTPKLGRGGALTLQGYGELKSKFSAWLKQLRLLKKDVVLIAHMDEQRSGDEIVERLDVQGGSKGEIYKCADAMGRIVIQPNGQRVLDFSPRANSFGKNPCNLDVLPFPDPHVEPHTLANIVNLMKSKINEASAAQKQVQSALDEWRDAVETFTTADEINRVLPELKDKGVAVRAVVANHAKKLGLVFDKASKVYEEPSHATA